MVSVLYYLKNMVFLGYHAKNKPIIGYNNCQPLKNQAIGNCISGPWGTTYYEND